MVFPGEQEATWTYDKKAKAYYFHRFYEFQPDLNIDNPEVWAEIQRIMGYWLELGVAGFRVDALPFILETPAAGQNQTAKYALIPAAKCAGFSSGGAEMPFCWESKCTTRRNPKILWRRGRRHPHDV